MTGGKVEEADTDCRKCGKPMPPQKTVRFGPYKVADFRVTAYLCECGHWNDLKRRKPRGIDPDEVRK